METNIPCPHHAQTAPQSAKIMVTRRIVPDDGLDGIFWRDGQRWLREHGIEYRLIDLAPNLEAKARMEDLLKDDLINQLVKDQTDVAI